MSLLKKVEITNFECFREPTSFDLDSATFFIGENNLGKSSVFRAICIFFGELAFGTQYLNETEHRRKKAGSNTCKITIVFDLTALHLKALRERLLKLNQGNNLLRVTRQITAYKNHDEEKFLILGRKLAYEDMHEDIRTLIESVTVNYIHPHQGTELLNKAQNKLQKRLLDNWGRATSVSKELNKLEKEWQKYRQQSNLYLSSLLTTEIQSFWGKGKVSIELPSSIRDIIKVGDVRFQAADDLPAISLTSQGTGVQQSLLYYASYVLDSDRTLRRNKEYNPVWLLEEPESFLHADMIIRLAKDLTSAPWLANIQLLTTTHSGLLLASSMNANDQTTWNVLNNHRLKSSFKPGDIDAAKIEEIGNLMGDPKFEVYFRANENHIFIEDKSGILIAALRENNITATGLGGIDVVKKYVSVLTTNPFSKTWFIVDDDLGAEQIKDLLTGAEAQEDNEFRRYKLKNHVTIILLPKHWSMECLFEEFDSFVEECVDKICDENLRVKDQIDRLCIATASKLHDKYLNNPVPSRADVVHLLKRDKNVKHEFWRRVKAEQYDFKPDSIETLKRLLT